VGLVFFTFALSGPITPKEMGVILGVAVLLDTLLVRLLLAVLRLLGPHAWWTPACWIVSHRHCGCAAADRPIRPLLLGRLRARQQSRRGAQVGGVVPLVEPGVDGGHGRPRLAGPAGVAQQLRQARRGPQLQ